MGVSVYDSAGRQFYIGEGFHAGMIEQPLVTEQRTVHSFPFGDCELVQLAFSGIYIVYGDIRMRERQSLRFELTEHHKLVEMHFTLSGRGQLKNQHDGSTHLFRENQHNLHYTPFFSGIGEYASNELYKFFEVHFTREFFLELAAGSSPELIRFAEQVAADKSTGFGKESLEITFAMHQCIQDIMSCRYTGGLKLMFLQSKCIELLAMQAQAYEDLAGDRPANACKSDHDRECIRYAREYLLQHAQHPPSLTELARLSGVNEFKLKQGFRELFGTTVFGYLSDHKLNQGRELLLSGSIAIKQIADDLGYSSVQHFSQAFRKKFGQPPGQLRRTQ